MVILIRADQMISERQHAYLDAIGIEVWSLRESGLLTQPQLQAQPQPQSRPLGQGSAPAPVQVVETSSQKSGPSLRIGSGSGGLLLVCAADVDSASRLANDISRALGSVPVWAWPDDEETAVELATAVDEKLFTTVAVFGDDLTGRFFEGPLPSAVNSAKLVLLPSMQDIQTSAEARQSLWDTIYRSGMVVKREQQA
jgi:DNA polymerase III psi subunit